MTITPGDLDTWRSEQRRLLIARREAIDPPRLLAWRVAIDGHLRRGFPGLFGATVALCWPYRNEYDARHLAAECRRAGSVTLLPVVVGRGKPLVFREWRPGIAMAKGPLGIQFPKDSREAMPDVVLLPMVGFDDAGYRLGYGGGYFDRTLAALAPRPKVIGVAHELAHMATIYPQKYDIPVDFVVTERGIYRREGGRVGGREEDREGDRDGNRDSDCECDRDGALEFLDAPSPGRTQSDPEPLSSPVCYANSPELRKDQP